MKRYRDWRKTLAMLLVMAQLFCLVPEALAETLMTFAEESETYETEADEQACQEVGSVELAEVVEESESDLPEDSLIGDDLEASENAGEDYPEDDPDPAEPVYYEIIFDTNGHGEMPQYIGVEAGTLLTYAEEPVAEGFVFTGWYRDPECETLWDFETDLVTDDMILYAGWEMIPVEVDVALEDEDDAVEPEYQAGETDGETDEALAVEYEEAVSFEAANEDATGSDSSFSLEADGETDRLVAAGDTVTLTVTASGDIEGISYQWYNWTKEQDEANYSAKLIQGATNNTYKTAPISENAVLFCRATIEESGEKEVWFSLSVGDDPSGDDPSGDDPSGDDPSGDDSSLSLEIVGRDTLSVKSGGSVTLRVRADAPEDSELTYEWYKSSWNKDKESFTEEELIEGANGSAYTTDPIDSRTDFTCVVTDQYNNEARVHFLVELDNELRIERIGQYDITVKPNETINLEVNASCKEGNVYYRWQFKGESIEGADGPIYTTNNPMTGEYDCYVDDDYLNTNIKHFFVTVDNGLSVRRVGRERVTIPVNGNVTLQVNASCDLGNLTYEWKRGYGENQETVSTGRVSANNTSPITLNLKGVGASDWVECDIQDEYGNERIVGFNLVVNGFFANRVGCRDVNVLEDGTAELKVSARCAEGTLSYQWYTESEYYDLDEGDVIQRTEIPGATASSYTVNGADLAEVQEQVYVCVVKDDDADNNNQKEIDFAAHLQPPMGAFPNSPQSQPAIVGKEYTFSVFGYSNIDEWGEDLIHYQWQSIDGSGEYVDIEEANREEYTFTYQEGSPLAYRCVVSDNHGNERELEFNLQRSGNVAALSLGSEVVVSIDDDTPQKLFSYTPEESGVYTLDSLGGVESYGYLYDSD